MTVVSSFSFVTGNKVGTTSHALSPRWLLWLETTLSLVTTVNEEIKPDCCSNLLTCREKKTRTYSHDCYFQLFLFLLGTRFVQRGDHALSPRCSVFIASFSFSSNILGTTLEVTVMTVTSNVFSQLEVTTSWNNSHDCYFQRFLLLLVTRLETTFMTVTSNRFHHLLGTNVGNNSHDVTSVLFCCYWWQGWRQQSWLLLPTLFSFYWGVGWRQHSWLLFGTFSVFTGDNR